jgi:hypothetical protein
MSDVRTRETGFMRCSQNKQARAARCLRSGSHLSLAPRIFAWMAWTEDRWLARGLEEKRAKRRGCGSEGKAGDRKATRADEFR